jgi:hypothetical protein
MKVYDIITGKFLVEIHPKFTLEQALESLKKDEAFYLIIVH